MNGIDLYPANDTLRTAALQLATAFHLSIVDTPSPLSPFLHLTPERLELRLTIQHKATAVYVDFINGTLGYRRYHDRGRQQPLGRAIGLKPKLVPTVLDATAGLGRDAFVLACLGCRVQMVERSPVIAALLEDGLQRAYQNSNKGQWFKENLRFTHVDARHWLQQHPNNEYPDVIYIDPMYPPRRKSALVKKESQLLQKVAGKDIDSVELLQIALHHAQRRVVVKRPCWAPPLSDASPSLSIESKNTRFDVYLTI